MRLDTMKEQEIKTRCETALEKLKALQPQLNAIVTFVDIDEQGSRTSTRMRRCMACLSS